MRSLLAARRERAGLGVERARRWGQRWTALAERSASEAGTFGEKAERLAMLPERSSVGSSALRYGANAFVCDARRAAINFQRAVQGGGALRQRSAVDADADPGGAPCVISHADAPT